MESDKRRECGKNVTERRWKMTRGERVEGK